MRVIQARPPCSCTAPCPTCSWDVPLDAPAGVQPADVGIGQWQPGLTFGEVSERTMAGYYK